MTNQEAIHIIKNVNANNNCITCYYMHDITCEEYKYCRVEKALKKGIEALENQKTGHWIVYAELTGEWEGTKKYVCDKCGEKVGVFKSNFCPNCGAKMEGE